MSTDKSGDPLAAADPEAVLAALGQPYSTDILEAAATPRSAGELSEELDMPIATSYRRVEELSDVGLLVRYDPSKDRTAATYERAVEDLYLSFRDGLSVASTPESKVDLTLDRLWRRFE